VLKEEFPEATDMIEKLTIGLKDKKAPMKKETKRGRSAPLLMDHPVFRASPSEKPRQLILSLIMFTCIMYFGWSSRSFDSDQEAFRSATVFVFVAFEMFIFLQVRDLLTVWPHPGFWRLIFGAGAFYALVLVSMLMLDFVRARWILESLLGDIGSFSSYEKKTEAIKEDVMGTCSMTWQSAPQVLFNQIFMAPWFLSHALGWMGKMMIFRDWKVCLIGAFLFECTEATLCYVCPEFEGEERNGNELEERSDDTPLGASSIATIHLTPPPPPSLPLSQSAGGTVFSSTRSEPTSWACGSERT
jgi:hypothetical protein